MASKRWLMITVLTVVVVWAMWLAIAPAPFATMVQHWAVAVTMIFGSAIAGATCEGGGAVAFPIFTKVLHVDPQDAKWFTLAIQSVGMTAAAVTIFAMRRTIDRGALVRAAVGGAIGILIGLQWVAPAVQPRVVRVLFTMMQCGFAATLLMSYRLPINSGRTGASKIDARSSWVLFATGVIGGIISSLFGHGLDLVTFSVLVLLFRVDERVATPTTVVLMATNSLVGFAAGWATRQYPPVVLEYWVAAIPIVVVGAPLGAICCRWLSRSAIVGMLVLLITVELVTTLWLIPMTLGLASVAIIAGCLFVAGFLGMSRCRQFWPERREQIEWAKTDRMVETVNG